MTHVLTPSPTVCPTLVGRKSELAALDALLARTSLGNGCTLRIIGEAGVGKSRLIDETIAHAVQHGFRIMRSYCFEPDRALPYSALIDLLRPEPGQLTPDAILTRLGSASCRSMPPYSHILLFRRLLIRGMSASGSHRLFCNFLHTRPPPCHCWWLSRTFTGVMRQA
jgi:hypothetical protein